MNSIRFSVWSIWHNLQFLSWPEDWSSTCPKQWGKASLQLHWGGGARPICLARSPVTNASCKTSHHQFVSRDLTLPTRPGRCPLGNLFLMRPIRPARSPRFKKYYKLRNHKRVMDLISHLQVPYK